MWSAGGIYKNTDLRGYAFAKFSGLSFNVLYLSSLHIPSVAGGLGVNC